MQIQYAFERMDDGEIILDDVPKKVFSNVEKLESLGLDVPQVTQLANILRGKGIEIPNDILTVDEAVDALKKILGDVR